MSVLVRGGRIVTAKEDYVADIFIQDETITLIGESLQLSASTVIDATGKYVLPGCVDPHTHIESAFLDVQSTDDFTSGTTAAAVGGTTTIVEFCEPAPNEPILQALERWNDKLANSKPLVDVGFHVIIDDLEDDTLALIPSLVNEGITSFKLFMAYKDSFMVDDETLLKVMNEASQAGALVMVHAENGGAVEVLVQRAVAEGKREPRYHALTRPVEIEAEATNRAIALATIAKCPLYVVHVSCAEATSVIARARAAGLSVWGETCPHYLLFDDTVLDLPGFEGAKYVYSPPPRPKSHQEALWQGLRTDALSVVSTDHSPYPFAGGKTLGRDDFSKIANGVPGIEERLLLLHEFGVRRGEMSLHRMVEVLSTAPAKLFGLFPKKGTVAVGSDGDLVVFDPASKRTLSSATQHSRCDYSIYEGMEVTGQPVDVLVRGRPVVRNGELVGEPGTGRFIKRRRFHMGEA